MQPQNTTDQALAVVSFLNTDERQNVLDFMKMLDLCDLLKLSAEHVPGDYEWSETPVAVRRLVVLATEQLSTSNGAYMSLLHSWETLKEKQIAMLKSHEDHTEPKESVECAGD